MQPRVQGRTLTNALTAHVFNILITKSEGPTIFLGISTSLDMLHLPKIQMNAHTKGLHSFQNILVKYNHC